MAKKKDVNFFANIAKNTGGLTLDVAGEVPYYIDTGNLALNFICSGRFIKGGYPGGKIIEVFGPPATSKSLLGFCALASVQLMDGIAVLLDCERAANAEFARRAGGVNPEQLITYEPCSIEEVEAKIIAATKAIRQHFGAEKPILFVWDSIAVSPTEREWKETDLPENPTKADVKKAGGNERPGERARAVGDLLRKINPFLDENNATLFAINQIRSTIGVMYGPSEITPGGRAMEFYASCRLRTSAAKTIENKNGLPLGVNLKFKNRKSRAAVPGLSTDTVRLFFEAGIDPLGGLLTVLLAAGRLEGKGGNYKVAEPYAGGKEVKFKAKSADNTIPMEVLLEAPGLIDAATQEEVETYLNRYSNALKLAQSGAIIEKDVKDDTQDDDDDKSVEDLLGLEESDD